jgi:hypothetical protein
LPKLQQFATFAQNNSDTIVKVALAVGALSAAILVLNTAVKVITASQIILNAVMAANPIGLAVVAVAALVAGFVLLVKKTGSISNAFKTMGNFVIGIFEGIGNTYIAMINKVVDGLNLINPFKDIPHLPKLDLPRFNVPVPGGGGDSGGVNTPATPDFLERSLLKPIAPVIPSTPTVEAPKTGGGGGSGGGGTTKPRTGLIDDLKDVMPIGDGGIGGGGIGGGNDQVTIMVNVNAAIAEASIGQTIVDALTDYTRRSGPLQLEIA